MSLPHPQILQDWLTQAWNIALGTPLTLPGDGWLLGPFGRPGGIHERVLDDIAGREGLTIDRSNSDVGLLDDFSAFPAIAGKIDSRIEAFYATTPAYAFEVWSRWSPGFGVGARAVSRLFSRRIGQLNLPEDALDTAYGISSEVVLLRQPDGEIRHRLWLRRLLKTGDVIYCGLYTHTRLPSGEPCLKVVFPLPHGNATVIMSPRADPDGSLELSSRGRQSGDPGFYFLLEDRHGGLWKHYLRQFHERIHVFVDRHGCLRADHTMSLWGRIAFALHYKIGPARPAYSTRQTTCKS